MCLSGGYLTILSYQWCNLVESSTLGALMYTKEELAKIQKLKSQKEQQEQRRSENNSRSSKEKALYEHIKERLSSFPDAAQQVGLKPCERKILVTLNPPKSFLKRLAEGPDEIHISSYWHLIQDLYMATNGMCFYRYGYYDYEKFFHCDYENRTYKKPERIIFNCIETSDGFYTNFEKSRGERETTQCKEVIDYVFFEALAGRPFIRSGYECTDDWDKWINNLK